MIGYVRKFDLGEYRFIGLNPILCRIIELRSTVCRTIDRNDETMIYDVVLAYNGRKLVSLML